MRNRNFTRTPPRSAPRAAAPLDRPEIRVSTCTIRRRVDGKQESIASGTTFAIADGNELADYEALGAVRPASPAEIALFERANPRPAPSEPASTSTGSTGRGRGRPSRQQQPEQPQAAASNTADTTAGTDSTDTGGGEGGTDTDPANLVG